MDDNKGILETKDDLELITLIAKDYAGKGLTQEELIEAGKDGIAKAREHYKMNYDFRFNAYAVWWIRQAILQAIAEREKEEAKAKALDRIYDNGWGESWHKE